MLCPITHVSGGQRSYMLNDLPVHSARESFPVRGRFKNDNLLRVLPSFFLPLPTARGQRPFRLPFFPGTRAETERSSEKPGSVIIDLCTMAILQTKLADVFVAAEAA